MARKEGMYASSASDTSSNPTSTPSSNPGFASGNNTQDDTVAAAAPTQAVQSATPATAAPAADDTAQTPDAALVSSTHHDSGLPHVHLKVFVNSHRQKPDQLAGFMHYAKTNHPGRHTLPDWEKFLIAFNQRVIK